MSNEYEQNKNKMNQNIEERRENTQQILPKAKKSYGQLIINPV